MTKRGEILSLLFVLPMLGGGMEGKMKKVKKKWWVYVIPLVILLIVLAVIAGVVFSRPVVWIDEVAVPQEELQLYLDENRAETIAYYSSNYDVDFNNPDAWDETHDNQTPKEYLLNLALTDLVREKTLQKEGISMGLDTPLTYKEMEQAREEENQSRSEKTAKGEVIYGPEEYGQMEYRSYMISNLETEIKEKLFEQEVPSEEELNKVYEELDPFLLDKGYSGQVGYYYFPNNEAENFLENRQIILEAVKNMLEEGNSQEEIEKICMEQYGTAPEYRLVQVGSDSMKGEDTLLLEIYEEMKEVKTGECKAVEQDGQLAAVLYMQQKEELGKKTYEEAQDLVESEWMDNTYEQWMQQNIEKVSVKKSKLLWWKVKV